MAIQVLNSSTTTVDASSATPIVVSVTNVGLTGPAGADAATLIAGTGVDIVGTDISVDVSDFLSNGADNRIVTATGTDNMNAEANLTWNGIQLGLEYAGASGPQILLTKTGNDNTGPIINLISQRAASGGAAGVDGDDVGQLQFNGYNNAGTPEPIAFAKILGEIEEADDGDEAGKLSLQVSNDGTLRDGIVITGDKSTAGEVDVAIGAGAASTTTISGTLTMGSTAAMTNAGQLSVAAQPNITSLGTLTSLQVDNINIDGNTITSSTAADLTINVTDGQSVVIEGVDIDDGVVTGASSITSTSFVGALTGNASTATALATPRAFQTDLASTSAVNFDGSAANTHGVTGTLPISNGGTGSTSTTYCNLTSNVTGTLPVANGGTGKTSLTDGRVLIGNGTSAIEDASLLTFTSSVSLLQVTGIDAATAPTLSLNSINDASGGGLLQFANPSDGENNDVLGTLEWQGADASSNSQDYAQIVGSIAEATNGQEGGKLEIKVASHDGTLTNGLVIQDGDASGELDVTIGAGASSVTTISGSASTGQLTPTSIVNAISGNSAGDFGSGAEILTGISNDSVTAGSIYVLRNGVWTLIDADAEATASQLVGVATAAAASSDSSAGMIIKGCVTLASAYTAGSDSEGAPVYASATAGEATLTAPSSSGQIVRILGFSLNVGDKKMFLNPDNTFRSIS